MSTLREYPLQNTVRYRNKEVSFIQSFTGSKPDVGEYIKEYFARNKGFVPSNYAIGTKVVTA